jgi:hypothetical protein
LNQQLSDEIDLRDRAVNCRKKILKNSLHRLPSTTKNQKKKKTPPRKSPKTIGRKTPSFDDEGNEIEGNHDELMDVEQPEMGMDETVPVETVVKKDLRTTDEFQFLQIYNTMNYRSFLSTIEDEQDCEEKATNDIKSSYGSDNEQKMVFSLILSNMFEFLSEMAVSNEELQEFQQQQPPQDLPRQKSSTSTQQPAFSSSSTFSSSVTNQQQPVSSSQQFKEWHCSSCTFYNKKKINSNAMNMITLLCDMCGTPFPSSSSGSTVRSPSSLEKKLTTTTPAIGEMKKGNSSLSSSTPTTVMTPWTAKKATIPSASIATSTKANKAEVIELLDSSDEELEKTVIVAVEKELEVIMIEDEPQKSLSLVEQPIHNNYNNTKSNLSSTSTSSVSENKDFLSSLHFDDWKIHSFIQQYLYPYQLNGQDYSTSSSSTIKMDLSLTLSNYNVKEREENNLLQDCLKFFLPLTTTTTTTTALQTANESNTNSSLINNIVLKSFYVHGKRFGDPTINKGKSVFCGQDDSFLNVEQFVMQKCLLIDSDEVEKLESAFVPPLSVSRPVSRNSGQMNTPSAKKKNNSNGKKTAGSGSGSGKKRKRKTLEDEGGEVDEIELLLNDYKDIDQRGDDEEEDAISPSKPTEENNHDDFLEMKNFTIVPYTEIVQECGGWDGWHCEGAILRILFGILMFPVMYSNQQNVFLTPYQDSPLDFPYPSFYSLRYFFCLLFLLFSLIHYK